MHIVPAVGVGGVPGVHCQPAWHICPTWQMWPGKHTAGVGELGPVDVPGGAGDIAMHPVSRKASGKMRMCFPRSREQHQTPATLNPG